MTVIVADLQIVAA